MVQIMPGHLPLDYAASGPVRWLLQRFRGRDRRLEAWNAGLGSVASVQSVQQEIPMGNPAVLHRN